MTTINKKEKLLVPWLVSAVANKLSHQTTSRKIIDTSGAAAAAWPFFSEGRKYALRDIARWHDQDQP